MKYIVPTGRSKSSQWGVLYFYWLLIESAPSGQESREPPGGRAFTGLLDTLQGAERTVRWAIRSRRLGQFQVAESVLYDYCRSLIDTVDTQWLRGGRGHEGTFGA